MNKILFPWLLLVFSLSCAFAGDTSSAKKLSTISDFAFGGIGVAGTISNGEVAFREILKSSSAEEVFVKLLKEGNAQARCYALVALRSLSPKAYAAGIEKFGDSDEIVRTVGGCMILELPMHSVIKNIEAGHYDVHLKK